MHSAQTRLQIMTCIWWSRLYMFSKHTCDAHWVLNLKEKRKWSLRRVTRRLNISGGEGWKPLSVGHCFSSIFDNSRKKYCQAFSVTFALRLYNSYNHNHASGQHIWNSTSPRPESKCSKTVEVGCSCQVLKHCLSKIATSEIQEKKIIESTAI